MALPRPVPGTSAFLSPLFDVSEVRAVSRVHVAHLARGTSGEQPLRGGQGPGAGF